LIDFKGTGKNEEEVVGLANDLRCHFTLFKQKITRIELNRVRLAPN
jgi:hypothetical protein